LAKQKKKKGETAGVRGGGGTNAADYKL